MFRTLARPIDWRKIISGRNTIHGQLKNDIANHISAGSRWLRSL